MVNRQTRNPGEFARFSLSARIGGAPDFAVDTGQAARALASVAGGLSDRLGKLADEAAARAGTEAWQGGSAAAYMRMQAVQAAAATVAGVDHGAVGSTNPEAASALAAYAVGGATRPDSFSGMKPEFSTALSSLFSAAPPEIRDKLRIGSGYRSVERQRQLWEKSDKTGRMVARPGRSRHNHGDAADLKFLSPEAKAWVHANAAAHGLNFPMSWEPWHVELVGARGGGRRRVEVDADNHATASVKANLPAVPVLSTQPLALRRDGTIFGEAYDRAAMSTYAWTTQARLESELAAASEAFPDDPAGLAGRLSEIHAAFSADQNLSDPQLREAFDKRFVERSQAEMLQARSKATIRMRQEEQAAALEGISAQRLGIERQAAALGASAEGDAIVAREVEKGSRAIDGAVAAGSITPAQGVAARQDLAESAGLARVQGVFDALETPRQKEEFATSLLEDWKTGKGPLAKLPFDRVKAMADTLFSDARQKVSQQTAAEKVAAAAVERQADDDIAAMQSTGKGLDPAAGLSFEKVEAALGTPKAIAWRDARNLSQKIWQATAGMEGDSAAEIARTLDDLAKGPKPGEAGHADHLAVLAAAQEKAKAVLKEREVDPLGQAMRAGAVTLEPIDTSTPERMRETLAARHAAGVAVAGAQGQDATFFRPTERAYLARALTDNPDAFPDFAAAVVKTFGRDAPRALAEISEDAPALAHAAGLTAITGDNSVATDIARVLSAKKQGLYKMKMPSAEKTGNAAAAIIGDALSAVPRARSTAYATAMLLFEEDANRTGFDPDEIGTDGSRAQAAFERAVDRALGGSTVNGVKRGGIGTVNGGRVIIPPDMSAGRVQTLISGLTDEDLKRLPPIRSANGVAVGAAELRNARLVSVSDGTYRMALGDPSGLDPRYVMGENGFWTLDIEALDRMRPANWAPFGYMPMGAQ